MINNIIILALTIAVTINTVAIYYTLRELLLHVRIMLFLDEDETDYGASINDSN